MAGGTSLGYYGEQYGLPGMMLLLYVAICIKLICRARPESIVVHIVVRSAT